MIKTLADLRRALVPGRQLTQIRHDWFPNGQLIGVVGTVHSVQSNGAWIARPGMRESFFDWPKASKLIGTANGFAVSLGADYEGKLEAFMEYTLGDIVTPFPLNL